MRILFKLTNHGNLKGNPRLLAYFRAPGHGQPMIELNFRRNAWFGRADAVPGATLQVGLGGKSGDKIVLFQRICGLPQVVTHLLEVIGPPAMDVLPNNHYPDAVPVKVLWQLDQHLFGVPLQFDANHDGLATSLPAPGAVQVLVRLHHLLALPADQHIWINDGLFRQHYDQNEILPATIAQFLSPANGFLAPE